MLLINNKYPLGRSVKDGQATKSLQLVYDSMNTGRAQFHAH